MKLNPKTVSQYQISNERLLEGKAWEHPWNKHMNDWDAEKELGLKRPNPPTKEAKKKAKFKDKTYQWKGK